MCWYMTTRTLRLPLVQTNSIMRSTIILLLLCPFLAIGQTIHIIDVVGTFNTTPLYVPSNITVNAGDTVRWICNEGTHNVYGELDIFPNNPEGFSSNATAQPSPWVYDHVFTLQGQHDFHCTGGLPQNPHSNTQFGAITVMGTQSVSGSERNDDLTIFPNPVDLELHVSTGSNYASISIMQLDGRIVRALTAPLPSSPIVLDVSELRPGQYILSAIKEDGLRTEKPFIKR